MATEIKGIPIEAHSIGQIVTLRKLQSSWDSKKYGA